MFWGALDLLWGDHGKRAMACTPDRHLTSICKLCGRALKGPPALPSNASRVVSGPLSSVHWAVLRTEAGQLSLDA